MRIEGKRQVIECHMDCVRVDDYMICIIYIVIFRYLLWMLAQDHMIICHHSTLKHKFVRTLRTMMSKCSSSIPLLTLCSLTV